MDKSIDGAVKSSPRRRLDSCMAARVGSVCVASNFGREILDRSEIVSNHRDVELEAGQECCFVVGSGGKEGECTP